MKQITIFVLLCFSLALTITFGQVPRKLSYQGLLTTTTGVPVTDGNYDLTFNIYNASIGGTLRHTETHSSVPVEKGTFSVTLGSVTAFAFTFTESLYVEVTVDNGPAGITYPVTFSSRTELTAAPYALGPWTPSDNNVTFNGNVGIGTSSPSGKLEVIESKSDNSRAIVGKASVSTAVQKTSIGVSGYAQGFPPNLSLKGAPSTSIGMMGAADYSNSEGAVGVYATISDSLPVPLFSNFSSALYADGNNQYSGVFVNGNVGIGTTSPTQALEVVGTTKTTDLQMTNGAANGYVLASDSNGNASWVNPAVVSGTGDNLGNHTATQNLKLGNYTLSNEGNDLGIKVNVFGHVDIIGHAVNSVLTIGSDTSQGDYLNFAIPGQDWSIEATSSNLNITYDESSPFKIMAGSTENALVVNGDNVGVGTDTPSERLDVIGNININAGRLAFSNTGFGTYIGTGAGLNDNPASNHASTFVGYRAGMASDGGENTAIGANAFKNNTTGGQNTALGNGSLLSNTTGSYNTALGYSALSQNTTANDNVAIGYFSATNGTTGEENVSIGNESLHDNTTGGKNTAIGTAAGYSATGIGNVFLGYSAGYNETGSNKLYIANDNTSTPLLYGDFESKHLTVNDSLTSKYFQITQGATNGYVLQSDASGNASWVNPTSLATSVWSTSGNHIYKNNSGNVGIGTSSPSSLLHVYASSGNADYKVESASAHSYSSLASPSGYENAFIFQTVNSGYKSRWSFGKSVATESGSNVGSDFFINRYDDAGSYLGQPFTINRSTGYVGVNTGSQKSTFDVNGSVGMRMKTSKIAGVDNPDGTATTWVYTTGAGTITFPTASDCTNRVYVIINKTGGTRTVSGYTDLSDTVQTSMANATALWIQSDGTNWLQIK